ncbi:MAG TPA: GIY-YIG nuclease family protein [Candidatus Moranbacteria bacterium]|nr:GIY-YIG nuclease family protein [Candidatus Moranbacteria bacterium]
MFYVYILISKKDNKFYIGYTNDLKRRLTEHSQGKTKSIKYRCPFQLLCYEAYNHKAEAMKRELFLKSSDGKKDLRKRLTISLKN